MSPHFDRLLVLTVMTVLVAMFGWIYARDRRATARLWMMGWIAIEIHFGSSVLLAYSLLSPAMAGWFAYATLLVTAGCFFLSVTDAFDGLGSRLIVWGLLFGPALAYWTLEMAGVGALWPYRVLLLFVLIPGIAMVFRHLPRPMMWSLAALPGAWALFQAPDYGMDFILFTSFSAAGCAYWRWYRRFTPGVLFTSFSLLLWGLVWPVAELCALFGLNIPGDNVVWDVPKYFVAFGMIVTLLEEKTEVLEAEVAERKRAEESAVAANEAKSLFLASMSHEIRTPMNGILGMTELVLDTRLTAEQREDLSMVRGSAESLMLVINDILDFSKIEAGKLEFETLRFDPLEVVGEMMRTMSFRAHQKGIELIQDLRGSFPPALVGDPGRLGQVLVNLIGNAIKFTERGEIVVAVETESASEEEATLHFSVRDTGIGIAADKQGLVFEAFTQADNSTTRKFGGTGLGLAIAKRLVELMGGRIWVESEGEGRGSTFHFTACFAVHPEAGRRSEPAAAASLESLAVLVVDDNSTNRHILFRMLKNLSMRPLEAGGGREALEVLRRQAEMGDAVRLILLDCYMPEMDGFETAARIQQEAGLPVPAIMLRSAGAPGDAERRRRCGIPAYLNKPVRQEDLEKAIHAVLDEPVVAAAPVVEVDETMRRGGAMRVLIAEDNPVNETLARRLLEKAGHSADVAHNGRQALEMARSGAYDLILMDVEMPEMDGLTAAAAIRERERSTGAHVPIIAMTAHAMKGDEEKCLAAGMDAYVSKPIGRERLFEAIACVAGEPEVAALE